MNNRVIYLQSIVYSFLDVKHRGEIVKKILKERGVNLRWLSEEMKVDRRTIYNWYEIADLPLEKIVQLGKIITYDFSRDIPEIVKFFPKENPENVNYKAKYFELLEKYQSLLEEQLERTKGWEEDPKNFSAAAEPKTKYKAKKKK